MAFIFKLSFGYINKTIKKTVSFLFFLFSSIIFVQFELDLKAAFLIEDEDFFLMGKLYNILKYEC